MSDGIEFAPDDEERQKPDGYGWATARGHGVSHGRSVTNSDGTTTTESRSWQRSWIEPDGFMDGDGI